MTPKQRKVLDFIQSYIATHRYPPSMREISVGVGGNSLSNAHGRVEALIKQGYLRRTASGARRLELVNTPVPIADASFEALVEELGKRGWFVVNKEALTVAQIERTKKA